MTSLPSRPRILILSYRFPPESYPLAIGLRGVIDALRKEWDIDVITAAQDAYSPQGVTIHHVPGTSTISSMQRFLGRVKLQKIAHLAIWPDPYWPWIYPSVRKAQEVIARQRPDAMLCFMMPFSTGYAGTSLKRKTGIPLVFNLNDSPTCLDMHPEYPSKLHYKLSRQMEDYFVQEADRVVYVSQRNRDRVAQRHSTHVQEKLRVVRCSASPEHGHSPEGARRRRPESDAFRIVYTGAMNGWHAFSSDSVHPIKKLYRAWQNFGTYEQARLDRRSHSPVFLGRAIREVEKRNPNWKGKVRGEIYGNTFPDSVVRSVLQKHDIEEVITVHGRIASQDIPIKTRNANLLFLTLPGRISGPPGGRISLKTYEYLMTDRPILGAVPDGENRDFLKSAHGTFITEPTDVSAMADVIEQLAKKHFSGVSIAAHRPELRKQCSSKRRAEELSRILSDAANLTRPVLHPNA